ncbi:MAG: hypothetical protein DI537_33135 [Stutzerimonas stutzeri]|nr:MAG: hypothetical protein DI537_33135 [Stutzerimonas stutzeri]
MQIELIELTNNGEVHNLSGHERGLAAREKFQISSLDGAQDEVVVSVPDFVYTITPSFFQGMFAESVKRFSSREAFLSKYKFKAQPVVLQQIDRGIKASLMHRGTFLS